MDQFKVKLDDRYLVGFIGDHGIKTSGIFSDAVIFNISSSTSLIIDIVKRTSPNCVVEFIPITTEPQPDPQPDPQLKELDLCEILKNAPEGLKLYSVVYGWVLFTKISKQHTLPVIFNPIEDRFSGGAVGSDGTVSKDGECTLFPSKNNRDWSTFILPYKLPTKGELCWTLSAVGNWIPRFATGEIAESFIECPYFFDDQTQKGSSNTYQWKPLSEVPEVLKNHIKLK